jgi:hypothetical protein
VLDPLARWRRYGEKPDFAGLLTYGGQPYTEDPAELAGADVAIVGAPTDDLVSDRPGGRYGPRAIRAASCPPGPHLETGVDALEKLRVVDLGDAPVLPADAVASQKAIEETVGQVVSAGALPVILGGDHSITEPDVRACAAGGPVGLVHFGDRGLRRRALARDADVQARRSRGRRPAAIRADRATWLLAGREGVLLAARARDPELLHARPPRPRDQGGRRGRARRPRSRPGLPHRGHRRPRSRLRARHGDARAWRDDITALAADRIVREILTGLVLARRAASLSSE